MIFNRDFQYLISDSSLVYFIHVLIYFSSITKQALFAYLNQAGMSSWNQQVLSNDGKVSCSRKQPEHLMMKPRF